jgi:hypothetical protein
MVSTAATSFRRVILDGRMAGDFEPYDFRVPFGLVTMVVGFWFLYAVFAPFPIVPVNMGAGGDCEVTDSPGVHLDTDWTLDLRDACGDFYQYHILYFFGFIIAGILFLHGGAKTIWEEFR